MSATMIYTDTDVSTALVVCEVHCLHCAACLEETIADVPGVVAVDVDGSTGLVEIHYRPRLLRIDDLLQALQDLGLRAS